jgi:hypothetical protein
MVLKRRSKLRGARNAVGKDGYQGRGERKVADLARKKGCVQRVTDPIRQDENDLAATETAQLHDRLIAR